MRVLSCALSFVVFVMLLPGAPGAAQELPACNNQMIRGGDRITIGLQQLSRIIDEKLSAAHSDFSGLQLTPEGENKLKVSGKNKGTPVSISGSLRVVNGAVKLHANHIVRDGNHEKGVMDFFGKDLADYAHFKKTDILSAKSDDLYIHPDPLLDVSGTVTGVWLHDSSLTLKFASQPCR